VEGSYEEGNEPSDPMNFLYNSCVAVRLEISSLAVVMNQIDD
jgi:hypothetical protein